MLYSHLASTARIFYPISAMAFTWRIIFIFIALDCSHAREPQCSNFDFQEKLLEKVIRSDIKMEDVTTAVQRIKETTEREIQSMKGKK